MLCSNSSANTPRRWSVTSTTNTTAATIGTAFSASADISITGKAEFNYSNSETTLAGPVGSPSHTTKVSANETATTVDLQFKGKNGATSIVADVQLGGSSSVDNSDTTYNNRDVLVKDLYISTKIGPVGVTVGNMSSPTTILLGEMNEGGLTTGAISLSLYTG